MTSMYDDPPNAGHWPGVDRRRHAPDAQPVDLAREHIDPTPVSTASAPAVAYDAEQLDPADLARLLALVDAFGLDPLTLSPRFHVGRTRRGYVVMLTTYDHDDAGQLVHVLGVPVTRHHIQPVSADELPAVCRTRAA